MKWYVVVCVLTVMFCVRGSDSFKILKKLKDILHPTVSSVSTSTVLPTIPAYEKQHGHREDDWSSSERESSTSNIKNKHSDEDSSSSQSSEHEGGSFTISKNKYNSVNPQRTKPYLGDSFHPDSHTTESSNYNSSYGSKKEQNQFSSYDSSSNNELRTTTYTYDQNNNNGNYPGQSSFLDGYDNQEVKLTSPNSYNYGSQNQPDQEGINDQRAQTTTENNYDGSYSSNMPEKSSSFGGAISEILSSTPKVFEVSWGNSDNVEKSTSIGNPESSQDQNNDGQTSVFSTSNDEKSQLTTSRTDYGFNEINNIPEQSSSFGGVYNNVGSSTSKVKNGGSQDKNYNDQSPVFNNVNSEKTSSSTPRNYDSSHSFDKPNQTSSFDNFDSQNSQTTMSNNNRPEQSHSYNYFNSVASTSTPTYGNTNYDEIDPGLSSGSSYNAGSFVSTSTTSTTPADLSEFSPQGGNQHNETSGSRPSYSTTKGSNQTKHQDNDDSFIFPDHPSLNPTPETERIFGENKPYFKRVNGEYNKTPAPVTGEDGRHIIDGPPKSCGPGQTFDKQKNICKGLARK